MDFSSFRDAPESKSFTGVFHLFELENGTSIREDDSSDYPAELGIVTGLLTTACIFNLQVTMLKEDFFAATFHLEHLRLKALFYFVSNLVSFCIFSPVIFTILVLLSAYRCIVYLVLKIQLGDKFVGLMEGTDSVWAVEDASCKSVINILAFLETSSNTDLLKKLRELARDKLISLDSRLDKLSCLRKKKFGYFYWERCSSIDITEHVRWLDKIDDNEPVKGRSNELSLNNTLSKLYTQSLPQADQASWEILVSRNHQRRSDDRYEDMEDGLYSPAESNIHRNTLRVPIIFRVHHTLGDGFALFRLLLSTIADPQAVAITLKDNQDELVQSVSSVLGTRRNSVRRPKFSASNAEILLQQNKDLLGASMPFSLMISSNLKKTVEEYLTMELKSLVSFHNVCETVFEFATKNIKESVKRLADVTFSKLRNIAWMLSVLMEMPSCLIRQALRSMDNSALHGPKLSGEKIFSSWIETDSYKKIGERNLLMKIQRIKHATGTKFGDVLLAALSASLHKYFKQIGESAPKSLTVVLPARMSDSEETSRLSNRFSVGLLPLSISGNIGAQFGAQKVIESNKDPTIMERLFDVARNSHYLRGQSDYLVNFWVMKWLSTVLPEVLLRPMLQSYSTLIFSNVPGPSEVYILGYRLSNIVFWVPHRGTTGVGFSTLSYGGKMHLGFSIDKALVTNDCLLAGILENTVKEINNLHDTIYMSHFAKYLHKSKTASTNTESECCEEDS